MGFVGGNSGGVTPGPFPNPEAKPACADGTALGRVWESRSPPAIIVWGGVVVDDALSPLTGRVGIVEVSFWHSLREVGDVGNDGNFVGISVPS